MSMIATTIRIRASELDQLRAQPMDTVLERIGRELEWSDGLVFGTLLSYLDEVHGIALMKSKHDDLADVLSRARGSTYFFLTSEHQRWTAALDASHFSTSDLQAYYRDFSEVDDPQTGVAMLEAIGVLKRGVEATSEEYVVLLHVG